MSEKLRCAVIGVGYLGNFHAEKYANLENAELVAVCDTNLQTCQQIAERFNTKPFTDYQQLVGQVDAVSIVTPTITHFKISKFFLENNIHVLVEKPITETVEEAEILIDIAKKNELVFQVGHLERFNNALLGVKEHINEPRFIESHRLAIFNPRGTDVNVMLDLMIHDIDIIQDLVRSPIKHIHANGVPILTKQTDIANARIEFQNHCVANVTASRVSFRNERRMRIFQPDAYITFDLHNKHLSIHRKGTKEMMPGIPDIISHEQHFDKGDAIRDEIIAFLNSITTKTPPVVSGEDGKRALATAIHISHLVHQQFETEVVI